MANRIKNLKEGDDEDLFDRGESKEEEEEGEEAEGDKECEKALLKVYSKEEIAEIEKAKVKEQLDREKKRKTKYDEDVRFEDL